jgi:DNA-binding GntR family transcriptional regulator
MMSRVSSAGYWSEFLGDQAFYFCFARKMCMQDGTRAAAHMYIPGSLSKDLDKVDVSELEMVNVRPFLETHLNLKINQYTSRVSVVTPDKAEIMGLGLLTQQPHYEISAMAFTDSKKPAYYQRIFVSVDDCDLEL